MTSKIVRMSQGFIVALSGKGEGIVIAPHVAGHMLGGSIWRITKDGEDVIYAVDYNHRKERYICSDFILFEVRVMFITVSKDVDS